MPRSTTKTKKRDHVKTKEDYLLDQAMAVFQGKKSKTDDAEDLFSKHVASGLRAVTDLRNREYAKVKIQEILFNAQFGLLGIPFPQQQNSFQRSFTEQLNTVNVASSQTLNSFTEHQK